MPARLRQPIEVIYRFARSADDIADEGGMRRRQRLAGLKAGMNWSASRPAHAANAAVRRGGRGDRHHALPIQLFRDLLDAFAQDVVKEALCRLPGTARLLPPFGQSGRRLVLHLFGRTGRASEQSDCICTALQLINFWRTWPIDWGKDRVYPFKPARISGQRGRHREPLVGQLGGADGFPRSTGRLPDARGAPLVHALPGRMGWKSA